MTPRIKKLKIEHFRSVNTLEVDGLGRVNLITGRNNSGKSSVLEAIRILASDASPSVVSSILRYREEDLSNMDDLPRTLDADGGFLLSNLFTGFPLFSDKILPIKISASSQGYQKDLILSTRWMEDRAEVARKSLLGEHSLINDENLAPSLLVDVNGDRRVFSLDYYQRFGYRNKMMRPEQIESSVLTCIFVSPYGGERTAFLGNLWDKIALTDHERSVVEALQIIDPEIKGVSMIGGEGPRQQRTAIVRSQNFERPVPLRSYGDGLNRLFGIVLSLVNAQDGILIIDEFENGMHHSVQLDTWRIIFNLAEKLNVQVFASSHSWDAIEAFQKAAFEAPEQGVLVRLTRRGDKVIPTVFDEDELVIATREHIEVR